MLEIVDVPKTGRKTGYISSAVKKGTWVVVSGTWTQAQIDALPDAQKNKPGYASVGALRLQVAYPGAGRSFPADKIYFEHEDSDYDHDTFAAGEAVTYYENDGTFRTSEFTDVTTTIAPGQKLKLSVSGTLTDEASLNAETENTVAYVEGLFISNTQARDHRLEFTRVDNKNNS